MTHDPERLSAAVERVKAFALELGYQRQSFKGAFAAVYGHALGGQKKRLKDDLQAILSPPEPIPEGEWLLVPREPTDAMTEAASAAYWKGKWSFLAQQIKDDWLKHTAKVYRIMLGAAPLPPAPIPVGERRCPHGICWPWQCDDCDATAPTLVEGEMLEEIGTLRGMIFAERGGVYSEETARTIHRVMDEAERLLSKVEELEGARDNAIEIANGNFSLMLDAQHERNNTIAAKTIVEAAFHSAKGRAEAAETALNTDRARIVEFFAKIDLGTGVDPVGFLLASHALMAHERNTAKEEIGRKDEALKNLADNLERMGAHLRSHGLNGLADGVEGGAQDARAALTDGAGE